MKSRLKHEEREHISLIAVSKGKCRGEKIWRI